MYGESLDYLSRYNASSPLAQKKSPTKYTFNEPIYFQPYTINKNHNYSQNKQWSNTDFHNIRRVSDDVGNLRQTFDIKSHSKLNQILSKYDYDNEQSVKTPQKSQRNLRNTFSARPQYLDNYKNNTPNATSNSYQKLSFLNQNQNKNIKSSKRAEKIQIQYNKYKQQLQELQETKKMAEELRKLKEDRRKRLQAGSKQGSTNINNEIRDVSDFKKKKNQDFYSPKYEKIDLGENIQLSKTVPVKNKVNLDKYKVNTQQKLTTFIPGFIEKDSRMDTNLQSNFQSYIAPKLNKDKNDSNEYNISKISSKSMRKESLVLPPITINDFQIGKALGQGRFGSVHQVIHKSTGAIFALKKIPKQNIKKLNMINQLVLQLRLQTYLNHQNIVSLYHHFEDSNYIYLLLEYMPEGTLFSLLKKKRNLPQKQVARKIQQISSAIKYLHKNQIAHRDIKPENIVINNGICKICDFGWATICTDRRKTCCGTFDYTPPQIFQGEQYDYTVDLWCLGVLTYELLVGKAPFYHMRRQQTKKRIINVQSTTINYPEYLSRKAINFIQSLLKKDPNQRLSSQQLLNHPFLQRLDQEQ